MHLGCIKKNYFFKMYPVQQKHPNPSKAESNTEGKERPGTPQAHPRGDHMSTGAGAYKAQTRLDAYTSSALSLHLPDLSLLKAFEVV